MVCIQFTLVAPDGIVVSLPLDPSFESSNPAEDDGSFMGDKIRSMTSFGEEVKPTVPCPKILRHVKDLYEYGRDRLLSRQNSVFP
jgi:hypothetical protein